MPNLDPRVIFTDSVFKILPVFGQSIQKLGVLQTTYVLEIAWEYALNRYEAALMVAYTFCGKLYEKHDETAADEFMKELIYIQDEWLHQKFVRPEYVLAQHKLIQ